MLVQSLLLVLHVLMSITNKQTNNQIDSKVRLLDDVLKTLAGEEVSPLMLDAVA